MPTSVTLLDGDCALSLSAARGFADWSTVWNSPPNQALHDTRKSPFVLAAGDVISVPDLPLKTVNGATDTSHRFVLKRVWARIHVRFLQRNRDGTEAPIAGATCKVTVGGVEAMTSTNGDGWIDVKVVPNARTATVMVDGESNVRPPFAWQLSVGSLLPLTTRQGALNRLANLGYAAPGENVEQCLSFAVRAFQDESGLESTGEFDSATCDQLEARHGI